MITKNNRIGSLALLSDAFHMVSDVLSLLIGLFAIRLAQRGRTLKQTFGWKRAEVIGALINGVFLMAVVLFIALEVCSRAFRFFFLSNQISFAKNNNYSKQKGDWSFHRTTNH